VVCSRTLVPTCLEALRSIAYTGLNTIGGGVLIVRDTQELVCRCCSYWFHNYKLNSWWKCSIMELSFSYSNATATVGSSYSNATATVGSIYSNATAAVGSSYNILCKNVR
jgi:hypothetical protein